MRGATFIRRLLSLVAGRFDLEVVFGYEHRQAQDRILVEDAVINTELQFLELAFHFLLSRIAEGPLRVLQIGANDGRQNDFMQGWYNDARVQAILVEPQREAFARLTARYHRNPRIFPVNCAVTRTGESLRIFRFANAQENDVGIDVLASFDRKHLEVWKERLKITSDIVSEEYPGETIKSLLEKMKWPQVHMLTIDTEGYDYEILRSLGTLESLPDVLVFEHLNLEPATKRKAVELMMSNNYGIHWARQDAFCVRKLDN
jgi:FkbM family methyltransferase